MDHNTLLGVLIPFVGTTAGAACVFFLKNELKPIIQKTLLGFASGVMVAASVWSLLIPSMNMCEAMGRLAFLPASIGFMVGILMLLLLDRVIPHLHLGSDEPEGHVCGLKKTTMLVLAVTLHNIPEGMAVGVVFAGFLAEKSGITLAAALALSLGIAIQNFPEGAIISLPLRSESGMSRKKAFAMGTLSGIVEPIGALAHDRRVPLSGTGSAGSPGACSRGDDLRGCGGADSGVGAGQSFRYGNDRICGWICADDDSGCGAGIKESWQCWHGIRLPEKRTFVLKNALQNF